MDDLNALADEHVTAAHADPHGRSAHLLVHEDCLRQSIIALTAGTRLDEHNAPRPPPSRCCAASSSSPPSPATPN